MLVIWFNPQKEKFYFRFYSFTMKKINDTNSYGHVVIAVYEYDYDRKCFVNSEFSEIEYFRKLERERIKKQKKRAIRNKIVLLIDRLFKT